jgi:hypothetical protein
MGKYEPLYDLLLRSGPSVSLTFSELADLVGGLPPSAHRHSAWWASDPTTHVQARAWLGAGYTAHADLASKTVKFARMHH